MTKEIIELHHDLTNEEEDVYRFKTEITMTLETGICGSVGTIEQPKLDKQTNK